MPIYEYVCGSCRHEFEELARSMSDAESPSCPNCDAKTVERRMSVFSSQQGDAGGRDFPIGGGCGRCGDPNGPCSS